LIVQALQEAADILSMRAWLGNLDAMISKHSSFLNQWMMMTAVVMVMAVMARLTVMMMMVMNEESGR
jgi:hypothetical protein